MDGIFNWIAREQLKFSMTLYKDGRFFQVWEEKEPDGANGIFKLDTEVIFLESRCSLTRSAGGQAARRQNRSQTFAQLPALTGNGAPPAGAAAPHPSGPVSPWATRASWGLALPPPHRRAGPGPMALHSPSASLGPSHVPQELTVRCPPSHSCPPRPAPRLLSPSPCPVSPQSSQHILGRAAERRRAAPCYSKATGPCLP